MRILIFSLAGLVAGPIVGFPLNALLEQFPAIKSVVWYPAQLIEQVIRAILWDPHGDQGFALMGISCLLQWPVIGMLAGLCCGIWFEMKHRKKAPKKIEH